MDAIEEAIDIIEGVADVVIEVNRRKSLYQKICKFKCLLKISCCSKTAETNHTDKMVDIKK